MTIGYFDSIETTPTTQAMKRVTQQAVAALKTRGFNLIPIKFELEDINEAREIFIGLILNHILGPLIKTLEANYESPLGCYKMSVMLFKANFVTRSLIFTLLRLSGNGRIYDAVRNIRPMSRPELDNLQKR